MSCLAHATVTRIKSRGTRQNSAITFTACICNTRNLAEVSSISSRVLVTVNCEDVALFKTLALCLNQNVNRFITEKASNSWFGWELLKGTGGSERTALVYELQPGTCLLALLYWLQVKEVLHCVRYSKAVLFYLCYNQTVVPEGKPYSFMTSPL